MEIDIFDFIIDLENDIAELYSRLKSFNNFTESFSVFEFMSAHSKGHAGEIAEIKGKYAKPKIDNMFFLNVQRDIKNSCLNEIRNAGSLAESMEILARTEELVGRMYQLLSGHYRKLAEHYSAIAGEIDHFAGEEFKHRDMMKKEAARYQG